MNNIAIVCCYMGKLPWYFDYFLQSCRYNSSIHFIVVSDDRICEEHLPENVHYHYSTLEDINYLASEKLGFRTHILNGYKLCDFKPSYGLLFSDLLAGYDFWGHGDIDVVFGDIRKFITDEVLINFDLIAVRHDFLTGYFLLFKNDEKMKWLFTHSKDYQKVLVSEKHFCFDETNFHFGEFESMTHFSRIYSEVESMTHVVKRLQETGYIRAYFDFHVIEGATGKISWNKGKLMYRNKYEAILYHLIQFKTMCNSPKRKTIISDSFNISPTRIYKRKKSFKTVLL